MKSTRARIPYFALVETAGCLCSLFAALAPRALFEAMSKSEMFSELYNHVKCAVVGSCCE